eukprot:TRINITY_DN1945_c0_g1_i1.p1 TRINITY_DN1945_c0_g1~~TRINITY_DN1945_c0_g1_i1.p1  ORF type:complete len:271 (-),score=58.34 TRINITY_DN1945_c0_g1_i1:296-1108(-)
MSDVKSKAKELWRTMTQGDGPMAIGTEGKADCPRCEKQIDFSQYSNQRGDEINAGNAFSCPHCTQLLLRWEPDSERSNCAGCKIKFFSFRSWNDIVRKHHCRMCGKIFCSECLTLCRVAGYGWEVHGNWIKLKLCHDCEVENQKRTDQMEKEKGQEKETAAAAAEGDAVAAPGKEDTFKPANSAANSTADYDPSAMAALKVSEEEGKSGRATRKTQSKPATSLFDDDISFITPANKTSEKKKSAKKKERPKALNVFEGGEPTPEKGGLFD